MKNIFIDLSVRKCKGRFGIFVAVVLYCCCTQNVLSHPDSVVYICGGLSQSSVRFLSCLADDHALGMLHQYCTTTVVGSRYILMLQLCTAAAAAAVPSVYTAVLVYEASYTEHKYRLCDHA